MVQVIQSKDISLDELQVQFNLQVSLQDDFFSEWQDNLPALTELESQQLKRVQSNYINLSGRKTFSEEAVKMVVLSPLLDLAGFYQAPFAIQTEESIEVMATDDDIILRGNIDVLVIRQQFWVLVIESKSTRFDVLTALPQALAYMLSNPAQKRPLYGLLVNGREFVFVKLIQQPEPIYARSFALSIERDNELQQVLEVLKVIRQKILDLET